MIELVDVHYPDADCSRVVMDQLNTHKPAAFYDSFPPEQAKAYLDRFEFQNTPKRGSWLNMAEISIGIFKRQCLDRCIHDAATLRAEVAAWQHRHDSVDRPIDWQFTADDARIKLRQLYPIDPKTTLEATLSLGIV